MKEYTIQNNIKNIDEYIETCINDEEIDYLKTIQQNMEEYELKIGKRMEFKKSLKEHNYE